MNASSPTCHAPVHRNPLRAARRLLRAILWRSGPVLTSQARALGVTVRAAGPSDIGPLQQLYASLSTRTRAQRFFSPLRELPREMLNAIASGHPAHRFLVAEQQDGEGNRDLLGIGQYALEPGQARCELAVLIADDWQGCGLGTRLLGQLLKDAAAAGVREARIETLQGNLAMQALARRAGFCLQTHPEDALLLVGCRRLTSAEPRSRGGTLSAVAAVQCSSSETLHIAEAVG